MTDNPDHRPPLRRASRRQFVWHYGPWIIEQSDWLRPHPAFDFDFRHEDYDGPGDNRCGSGWDVADCIAQINDIEEQE